MRRRSFAPTARADSTKGSSRSFKTIDLGERRRYQALIPLAALLALIVTYPHEVLLIMAYTYLASGFVDLAIHKFRRRDPDATPPH